MNQRLNGWMKPKRNPDVAEKLGRITLLFDMTAGRLYELNETGRLLWSLCDGKHDIDDMARIIVQQFEVSNDDIEQDILSFLQNLRELNLIRLDER